MTVVLVGAEQCFFISSVQFTHWMLSRHFHFASINLYHHHHHHGFHYIYTMTIIEIVLYIVWKNSKADNWNWITYTPYSTSVLGQNHPGQPKLNSVQNVQRLKKSNFEFSSVVWPEKWFIHTKTHGVRHGKLLLESFYSIKIHIN